MQFGLLALGFGDPVGGQAEGGLGGLGGAGDRAGGGAVVHGQELLGIGDALADGLALDLDDVIVGAELHVVADADRAGR